MKKKNKNYLFYSVRSFMYVPFLLYILIITKYCTEELQYKYKDVDIEKVL